MNFAQHRAGLERHLGVLEALVGGLDETQARSRPDPARWSVLEIVAHLADEEREDFRARLDILLHVDDRELPKINPQGWVSERRYNDRHLPDALEDFRRERRASLAWLDGLERPDWTRFRQFEWGRLHAGDVMVSWLAHDFIHIRQINRVLYEGAQAWRGAYSSDYAGTW